MYLKTIELTGFKSFPDKTLLDFTSGVTTIVGPNGSGKSNISDAIRWVLGEMRAKSLRGGSMQDVIFSGTEKRKALNFAEVSITIDNADKALNIDFAEVMITRRVFRSGESEYFINKTQCRMKDINELFMDTGLGRDGYSIVGQGKIDEIISGKPFERRVFFEEAAGISKYRHKKDEAERKLSQTNDNLLRILDIVTELEMRLPGLEKASKKAMKYLAVKEELKELEIAEWCLCIKENRENLTFLHRDLAAVTAAVSESKTTIEKLDKEAVLMSQNRRSLDARHDNLFQKEKGIEYNISTYKNQITLYENEILRNHQDIERLLNEKDVDGERLQRYDTQINERQTKIDSLLKAKAEIESEVKRFEEVQAEIERIKHEASQMQDKLRKAHDEKSKLTVNRNTIQSKVSYLSDMEKNYEGFQRGVKEIFTAHKAGTLASVQLYGTLSDIIKTDKKTALAFDAVLGATLQNIVCHDESDAKKAIEFLKVNALGRVTFLPVSKINTREYDFGSAVFEEGVLGKAVSLVTFDEKFKGIVSSLLGKTLIVDSYEHAVFISKKYDNAFRIVTLNGEVFNAGGSIVGGTILKSAGFLSKSADIAFLKKELTQIDSTLLEIAKTEASLSDGIAERENQVTELSAGLSAFNEKKANLPFVNQSILDEKENQDRVKLEKEEYLKGFTEKEKEIRYIKEKNESVKEDIDFKQEQIKGEEQNLQEVKIEIEEIRQAKMNIENGFVDFQNRQKKENDHLILKEQENTRLLTKIEKAESVIESLTSNLWESYEMTYSQGLEQKKKYAVDRETDKKRITELKSQVKGLGDVSVSSIEEFTEVSERYHFLNGQKNDLMNAKTDLETLISDMLVIMKDNFSEQFKRIDENFTGVFQELFGGGTASLKLLEPNDVLESGIDIIVQPPGKKLESITLLSGGEKAFTAIALLFAVLSLKPLPFCVFDEIEAALDDVNVYKFAEYIKKYKAQTQFILVSHRRGTMENADTLYGVTMQEKGISKLVSLNMHEIDEHLLK